MADKLKCSIEFEDEWRPSSDGCHWDYDRICYLTYEVLDSKITTAEFFYRIGDYKDYDLSTNANTKNYTRIFSNNPNLFKTSPNTWVYELRLSHLNIPSDGWFKITAYVHAKDTNNNLYTAYSPPGKTDKTTSYYLGLPPALDNLKVTLSRKSADHIDCTWTRPIDPLNSNSVAGYCIELFCKKKDSNNFMQVSELRLDQDAEYNYRVIKAPEIPAPQIVEDYESYIGQGTTSEVYIEDPNVTSFYFRPRDFGIVKDDYFMIRVYPYIVYSQYWDTSGQPQQSALLSSKGTNAENDSDEMKFTLGVVRVKTDQGWKEGQVWVMTASGWKEADSIYVKTNTGWKEAIS